MAAAHCGSGLALGEAVDPVVVDEIRDVQVAATRIDQVAGANAVAVAVTAGHKNFKVLIGQLDAGRHVEGAPVQGVQAVGVDVVRELAGAADARNHRYLVRRTSKLGQGLLDRAQNPKVAAAAAPVRMRVLNPEGLGC